MYIPVISVLFPLLSIDCCGVIALPNRLHGSPCIPSGRACFLGNSLKHPTCSNPKCQSVATITLNFHIRIVVVAVVVAIVVVVVIMVVVVVVVV